MGSCNTVMNLRVSKKAGNLTSWAIISFSRRTLLHGLVSWCCWTSSFKCPLFITFKYTAQGI